MEIRVEKKSENPLKDILDTILNLDETSFESAARTIYWGSDKGLNFFYDEEKIDIPISVIFDYLNKSISNYEENSISKERIGRIIESRNKEQLFYVLSESAPIESIDELDYLIIKKSFELLNNDELFEKFKTFNDNKESFLLPNAVAKRSQDIRNYLRVMISIFGSVDKDGQLINTNPILDDFYIPNIEEYKRRFIEIYKTYEPIAKEETKKIKYRFNPRKIDDHVTSVLEEEPEWQLNTKISEEIIKDMPDEMSPEEKAIFIYTKMCKLFAYDEGYAYREHDQGNKTNYTSQFSKEHLEALTLESRITCFDFSRIYKKIIDGLDEQMTAVILTQGLNKGHFYVGLATENCQATLEAVNITDKDGFKANDLARAKNNMKLDGIKFVSGKKEVLANAAREGYSSALSIQEQSTIDCVKELMKIDSVEERDETQVESMELLQNLISKMQKLKICGNEFVMFFNDTFRRFGILNESLQRSFVGEVTNEENSKTYKRKIWLREKQADETGKYPMYLIDTESLEISDVTDSQMIEKFKNGEFVYESKEHQMNEFELEDK